MQYRNHYGDMDFNPANQQVLAKGWYRKGVRLSLSKWYNAFGHDLDTSTE